MHTEGYSEVGITLFPLMHKIKSNIDYESALYGSFPKLKRNYISIFLCSSGAVMLPEAAYLSSPG